MNKAKILVAIASLTAAAYGQGIKEKTIHMYYADGYPYQNEWIVNKEAAKATGIKLRSVAPQSATNSKEAFNLLMVSNDFPDIVGGVNMKEQFMQYGMEGAFHPLNKLIEKSAPDIKILLDGNPDIKNFITAPDGNIYFIPYIPDGKVSKGWMIRKDWLDKLGLKEPANVNEFYEVMKAFRDKDPNGNGIKDEVPFMTREPNGSGWEVLRLATLFGARVSGSERIFGDFYEEQGVVKHAYIQPEFKIALENISKWYKEKLIDPEIFTRGRKAREILLGNDQAGITRDWFVSTMALNQGLQNKIPGFKMVALAPPADINGKVWEESMRSRVRTDGWGIPSSVKKPEEIMEYFNYFFTVEGRRLANFGVEGVQYDMVDGKPKFKDVVFNSGTTPIDYFKSIGAQIQRGYPQDFEYEKATATEEAVKAMEEYEQYLIPNFEGVAYNKEEKKIYDKNWPSIFAYMQERIQKWILGSEELNDKTWTDYLSKIDSMGYQSVIKATQSAYDRQKKQD